MTCVYGVVGLSAVIRAIHWSQVMSNVSQGGVSDKTRTRGSHTPAPEDGYHVCTKYNASVM